MIRASETGTTTQVVVDGQRYLLHVDTDVEDLKRRIETAARSEPTFVEADGAAGPLSILVTHGAQIVVVVELPRNTQTEDEPFRSVPDWEL